MLTRSRPLARPEGLYSDGAEYIPLAVSQTARVFVTTSICKKWQKRLTSMLAPALVIVNG
jgi:hypothetical protein